MTSPETSVSEAEVEAATESIRAILRISGRDVRDMARAALTAAAQVRAQAELIADNTREDQLTIAIGDELTEAMLGIRKGE